MDPKECADFGSQLIPVDVGHRFKDVPRRSRRHVRNNQEAFELVEVQASLLAPGQVRPVVERILPHELILEVQGIKERPRVRWSVPWQPKPHGVHAPRNGELVEAKGATLIDKGLRERQPRVVLCGEALQGPEETVEGRHLRFFTFLSQGSSFPCSNYFNYSTFLVKKQYN